MNRPCKLYTSFILFVATTTHVCMYIHICMYVICNMYVRIKFVLTSADTMFEPLKETIELLKYYGQALPDEVHQQLQVKSCIIYYVDV